MNKLLQVKDAETLYYEPIKRRKMIVDGLLPTGLTVFSGAPKIGKSYMLLEWCLSIAKGEKVWDRDTTKTGILYLSLEDTDRRIQERMHEITDSPPDNLRFVSVCNRIDTGLMEEIEDTMASYQDVGLIVIDTLQMVRGQVQGNINAYVNDYDELSRLKQFADRMDIGILVVHHTKKQKDNADPFNEVSGSTGITGTADTIMVMRLDKRGSSKAKLHIAGRDIERQELVVEEENMIWKLTETKDQVQIFREQIPDFLFRVVGFMKDKTLWEGTATELIEAMEEEKTSVNMVGKHLARFALDVLSENGIEYQSHRTGNKRTLRLTKNHDSCDSNDSIISRDIQPS